MSFLTYLRQDLRRAVRVIRSRGLGFFLARLLKVWIWLPGLFQRPWDPVLRPHAIEAARMLPFGVNLAGAFASVTGMGEATRSTFRALQIAGVPLALEDQSDDSGAKAEALGLTFSEARPYRFNVAVVTLTRLPRFARNAGKSYQLGHYSIGIVPWESEEIGADAARNLLYLDEIWTPSRFSAAALSRNPGVPVRCFPHPVPVREEVERQRPAVLNQLGVPPEACLFLFILDLDSYERKNPIAVIKAFERAFQPTEDVWLLIKTSRPRDARQMSSLRDAARGGKVAIVDALLSRPDLDALVASCSCYVSLHHSEGFGLTMAEAMALGKPVIATNYSGNLDYMTDDTAYLVDYKLTAIDRDLRPLRKGWRWAEPDVGHAARLMRRVYESPDEAQEVGRRAREHVRRLLSPEAIGRKMRERLEEISSAGGPIGD